MMSIPIPTKLQYNTDITKLLSRSNDDKIFVDMEKGALQ